jgi:tetratricopeptide (TPR) repeat protein
MWWARCQILLANNAFLSGDVHEAKSIYEDMLEIDRQIGNRGGETACLANLARIHLAGGKPDDALPLLEEALGIAKKIGNLDHEQGILVDLGNIHESRGAYDRAWRLWERGLEIARERGDRHGMVRLLVLMAILARDQNWAHCDPDVSESHWSRAMQVAQEAGDVDAEVRVLVNHGEILKRVGEIERAKSLLADGLRLTLDRGTGAFAAPLALSLAEIFLVEGDAESPALLVGAVRTRQYALLDEQILHQSEIEIGEAVRKALGDVQAEAAFERGARMGLWAVAELALNRWPSGFHA